MWDSETAVANMRMPMNFSLALDRSGSMYGDNIRQLRNAVKSMIDQLHDDDYISIIAFNSKTEILAKAGTARDKQKLHRQVDKLKASGGTNMGPAMQASLKAEKRQTVELRRDVARAKFLELLDPFWDYVKKIVSWTLVGYIFWY